jgi:hypothetical protein
MILVSVKRIGRLGDRIDNFLVHHIHILPKLIELTGGDLPSPLYIQYDEHIDIVVEEHEQKTTT